ncbi:hypothetical protein MHBO_004168 [Bonamia ostreae]|uniref:Uncharacterized protein n=1 Tax=Bonamia ostreae TaxID=126728 RepID=A0ABV2ASL0_9EUKA
MGNKFPNTSRITTNLVEENEPIPKMLPTWEKVLDSEKEELEASKCLFEAKGHDSCCKTIMDFKISRIISQTERINVFEVEDTATEVRFAVKIYEREKRKAYQKNEIRLLTILHDIEGDFVRCEHRFTTKNHNIIVLELFVSDFYDYMKHRNKMLSLEMARFIIILKTII